MTSSFPLEMISITLLAQVKGVRWALRRMRVWAVSSRTFIKIIVAWYISLYKLKMMDKAVYKLKQQTTLNCLTFQNYNIQFAGLYVAKYSIMYAGYIRRNFQATLGTCNLYETKLHLSCRIFSGLKFTWSSDATCTSVSNLWNEFQSQSKWQLCVTWSHWSTYFETADFTRSMDEKKKKIKCFTGCLKKKRRHP